jgi:anti-sigma-K factor RskA
MSADRHEIVRGKLDEYALGQLPPEERRDVETHVDGCAECASELRELMLVMEGLARAAEPVSLPPGLKRRVLDRLAIEPQQRAVKPTPVPRRDSWNHWLAAAAAVILALGILLVRSMDSARRAADDLQVARGAVSELRERLEEYAGQTDLALSILTAADMRRQDLSGADAFGGSAARAYWSPTRGLLVVADQLPVPPAGRIYQVWVIGGTAPVSAGLLGSARTGRGMLIVPPPSGVAAGPVTVAVTDEPPGGLPAPSGTIRLSGSL